MHPQVETLADLLRSVAEAHPARGISIFDARGRRSTRRTYPELLAGVQRTAALLSARGVRRGEVVLLSLDTSWELIESWFGAVLAGALPVVIAPPMAMGLGEAHLQKLEATLERLGVGLFLCGENWLAEAERCRARGILEVGCTAPALAESTPPPGLALEGAAPDDVAFLQLTSGSTGHQRGVAIPHRAALANVRAIHAAISAGWGQDVETEKHGAVSWLPLHHDMGLVGILLAGIAACTELRLLPPRAFLARPLIWLRELAGAGPCVSAAPNFAYHVCVDRYAAKTLEGVDLSGWHSALIGAEMVQPETMSRFVERMAAHGFEGSSLRPCYGMAEATLAVTYDARGMGIRTRPVPGVVDAGAPREVVCVGAPVLETELAIRAPDGAALPAGAIGEIHVRGSSVFAGYWRDPEATAEALKDGWLRTGDLGFLQDGELYITGRIKDLLILRGHNLMPHELEWCAEAKSGGGGTARSAAFSIPGDAEGERAVLVVETAGEEAPALAELERAIRLEVGDRLGLTLADVAFVRRGRLPRTTSGKVQRAELRRRYLAGELERLGGEATMEP